MIDAKLTWYTPAEKTPEKGRWGPDDKVSPDLILCWKPEGDEPHAVMWGFYNLRDRGFHGHIGGGPDAFEVLQPDYWAYVPPPVNA